jgi:hypothetical protein
MPQTDILVEGEALDQDAPVQTGGTLAAIQVESMEGDIEFYDTDDVETVTPSTPKLLVIGRFCVPESEGGNPILAAKAFSNGLSYILRGNTKVHLAIE